MNKIVETILWFPEQAYILVKMFSPILIWVIAVILMPELGGKVTGILVTVAMLGMMLRYAHLDIDTLKSEKKI